MVIIIGSQMILRGLRGYKLSLAREEGVDRGGELVAAVKELELEEEDEAHELAAHLLDQLTTSVGRAT